MFGRLLLTVGLTSLGAFTHLSLKEGNNLLLGRKNNSALMLSRQLRFESLPPWHAEREADLEETSISDNLPLDEKYTSALTRVRQLKIEKRNALWNEAREARFNNQKNNYLKEDDSNGFYYAFLENREELKQAPVLGRQYRNGHIRVVEKDNLNPPNNKYQGRTLHILRRDGSTVVDIPPAPRYEMNYNLMDQDASRFAREQLRRERPTEYEFLYGEGHRHPASQGTR